MYFCCVLLFIFLWRPEADSAQEVFSFFIFKSLPSCLCAAKTSPSTRRPVMAAASFLKISAAHTHTHTHTHTRLWIFVVDTCKQESSLDSILLLQLVEINWIRWKWYDPIPLTDKLIKLCLKSSQFAFKIKCKNNSRTTRSNNNSRIIILIN